MPAARSLPTGYPATTHKGPEGCLGAIWTLATAAPPHGAAASVHMTAASRGALARHGGVGSRTVSVCRTKGSPCRRRQAVFGRIPLAQLHVQTGESLSTQLAHQAITEVGELRSVRARQRLGPLVQALSARKGSHSQELVRLARQTVAA